MQKKFWTTVFTLVGTIIGAGILGLPYVFSKSGFGIGIFWLVLLGFVMLYVNLAVGEITLRTKGTHHLPGYAKKYLGKKGEWLVFFALIFGIYSALTAYLIGEGQSISMILFGSSDYALYAGIAFWLGMTILLKEGLRELRKLETRGVLIFIGIILVMFIWLFNRVEISNLTYLEPSSFFLPFGVVLFALLGYASIPELRREIKGEEKLLKKAITFGMIIPMILYGLFVFSFVGVLGENVPKVSTLAFGNIIVLLGIFTMLTSYFVLSFALKDVFTFDFHNRGGKRFFFVSVVPLLIYITLYLSEFSDFIGVLSVGGVVAGGVMGILVLIMNLNAKKLGNRKPEYSIPINWPIIVILGALFIAGIISELFF